PPLRAGRRDRRHRQPRQGRGRPGPPEPEPDDRAARDARHCDDRGVPMSVTAPKGYLAAGVAAGLKASGRLDLGLLVSERPASAGGLFTTNAFAAAPVEVCRWRLLDGSARAVVVNSGQANAGTGPEGVTDAEA